jgi:ubiquinone/menaquinone biosynthesis C-methylase UbiE
MSISKQENCRMPQVSKPTGFFGKLLARGMALGHRSFYENTARILDLKDDDKYLEIGFGSGLFIKKYASHLSRIAGIDCSEDMVKLASNINEGLVESGKAEFVQGDASALPWKESEFSVVVGIETFYFWPEPEKALKEIHRVLIPGGRLVIEMGYNKDDGKDHAKDIEKHNLVLYGGEEMEKLLKDSEFDDVSVYYFKSLWFPFTGYKVPKGMVVKAVKTRG